LQLLQQEARETCHLGVELAPGVIDEAEDHDPAARSVALLNEDQQHTDGSYLEEFVRPE
jgi:hypothetical protein